MANTGASFKVTEIKGEAYVQKPTGEIAKLNVGDVLEEGDILLTGEGEVTLTDQSGGETIVPAGATYTVPGAPAPELADTEGGEPSGEEPAGEEAAGEQSPLAEPAQDSQPPAQGQPQPQPQAQQPQPQSGGEGGDSSSDGGGSSFFNAPRSDYLQDNRFVDQGNLNRDINDVFDFMGRHTENPRIHYQFDLDRVQFPLYGPELHERGGGRRDDYTPPIEEHEEDRSDDPRMEVAPDFNSVKEDGPTAASGDVFQNDRGLDLKVSGVKAGTAAGSPVTGQVGSAVDGDYGSIKINADGSYTYELANDDPRVQALAEGETLTDTFVYTATDRSGKTATTTVTITINGTNDAPEISLKDGDSDSAKLIEGDEGLYSDGTLSIKDIDTSDKVTVNVKDVQISGPDLPGNLTPEQIKEMLTFGSTTVLKSGETEKDGGIKWIFDSGNELFDFIPEGKELTITYTVEVDDGHGGKDTHPVTITITGTNDAPVANPDVREIGEDTQKIEGNVIKQGGDGDVTDVDPDGDELEVVGVVKGSDGPETTNGSGVGGDGVTGDWGTITINKDGSYTYTPDPSKTNPLKVGQEVEDVFTYTISDDKGGTDTTTVTIKIIGENDPPVANADERTIDEDSGAIDGNVIKDGKGDDVLDFDPDGDELTVIGVGIGDVGEGGTSGDNVGKEIKGDWGTIKINEDGSYEYTPDYNETIRIKEGDVEKDVFTYTISDGNGGYSTTTVTINIEGKNDAPTANPDEREMKVGSADEGEDDGDWKTSIIVGNVIKGGAQGDQEDTDPDAGDILKVVGVKFDVDREFVDPDTVGEVVNGKYGKIVINEDGSYTYTLNNEHGEFANFGKNDDPKTETFTYTIEDEQGEKSHTTITITIRGTMLFPDVNAVTEDDADQGDAFGGINLNDNKDATTIIGGEVLKNDKADGLNVTKIVAYDGTEGDVESGTTYNTGTEIKGQYGTLKIGADGKYTYTLDNKNGDVDALAKDEDVKEEFTYFAKDSEGEEESTTLTITIHGANDAPVIGCDEEYDNKDEETIQDDSTTPVEGTLYVGDVDNNDVVTVSISNVENEGYNLKFTETQLKELLTFDNDKVLGENDYFDGQGIKWTFNPNAQDLNFIPDGKTATLVYTVTVTDKEGATASHDITINITGNDDTGKLSNDMTETIPEDQYNETPLSGDLFKEENGYEDDPDEGQTVKISSYTIEGMGSQAGGNGNFTVGTEHDVYTGDGKIGRITINADGTYEFYTEKNYSGKLEIKYQGESGSAEKGWAYLGERTLTIEVTPVADAPLINEPSPSTYEDKPVSLGLEIPVITDPTDFTGTADDHDNPERLGLITLEFENFLEGAKLFLGEEGEEGYVDLTSSLQGEGTTKTIEIKLTETGNADYHIKEIKELEKFDDGVIQLTKAQYESLKIQQAEHRHENIEVTVKATSYEVNSEGNPLVEYDDQGSPLGDEESVYAAITKENFTVDVKAVTDDVTLNWDSEKELSKVENVIEEFEIEGAVAFESKIQGDVFNLVVNEDTPVNLKDLLTAEAFEDVDDSETRWFYIENKSGYDIKVGDDPKALKTVANDEGWKLSATDSNDLENGFPNIYIQGGEHFSGVIEGIKIYLVAQDKDADSTLIGNDASPNTNLGAKPGSPHAPIKSDFVTLNLTVLPQAGDVEGLIESETVEDPLVNAGSKEGAKFLADLKVEDDNETQGSKEEITQILLDTETLEVGWKIYDENNDLVLKVIEDEGAKKIIDADGNPISDKYFNIPVEGDKYLEYTAVPPPHSSKDIAIGLSVTTKDTITLNDQEITHTKESNVTAVVTVTPVAEALKWVPDEGEWVYQYTGGVVDDEGQPVPDLTMTDGHIYITKGEEDKPFDLNAGSEGFNLKFKYDDDGNKTDILKWVNQDESEETYALLSPKIWVAKLGENGEPTYVDDKIQGEFVAATGAEFTWDGGGSGIFDGSKPVEIPIEHLDSVKFTPPPYMAGEFKIEVRAKTVDKDEDDGDDTTFEKISGYAELTNVIAKPVANEVTVSLSQSVGDEDTAIPLDIRPKSDDPNETFNVTILKNGTDDYGKAGEITSGTKFIYGGKEFSYNYGKFYFGNDELYEDELIPTTAGKVKITSGGIQFINYKPGTLSVQAPQYSDVDLKLIVQTEPVDIVYTSAGDPPLVAETSASDLKTLLLNVKVNSVADGAELKLKENLVWTEGNIDNPDDVGDKGKILLSEVIKSITMGDTDGSENLSIIISNIAKDEISIAGDNVTILSMGIGAARKWSIALEEGEGDTFEEKIADAVDKALGKAYIKVPENFNGKIELDIQANTTETRKNGHTLEGTADNGGLKTAEITVTPTPEAGMNLSASGYEETKVLLNFNVDHKHGDTDEYISQVWIRADGEEGVDGNGDDEKKITLFDAEGNELEAQGDDDGKSWYVISGEDALKNTYAQGPANKHGDFKFEVKYEVTDPGKDEVPAGTEVKTREYTLNLTGVTDDTKTDFVEFEKVSEDMVQGNTVTITYESGENASFDVKVNVTQQADSNSLPESADTDGSEKLTHFIVEGVPDGVMIDGGEYIGNVGGTFTGRWLVELPADRPFDQATLAETLKFTIYNSSSVFRETAGTYNHTLKIIAYSIDDGGSEKASITEAEFNLKIVIPQGEEPGEPLVPAKVTVGNLYFNPYEEQTDEGKEGVCLERFAEFKIDYTGDNVYSNTRFSITLTGLPEEFEVDGMFKTVGQDGKIVWTASRSGDQDALDDLVQSIFLKLPKDWNSNNFKEKNDGNPFEFEAAITSYTPSGTTGGEETHAKVDITPQITPVTDPTQITISDIETTEGQDVTFSIELSNEADGKYARIVDGKLYVKIESSEEANGYGASGTLKCDGEELSGPDVNGWYVLELSEGNGDSELPAGKLEFTYTPGATEMHMASSTEGATFTIHAMVKSYEVEFEEAESPIESTAEEYFNITPVSNGYSDMTGDIEAKGTETSGEQVKYVEIKLPEGHGLTDSETVEKIVSATITNVPKGFVIYTGADEGSAKMASNIGGDGDYNSWAIQLVGDELPGYIAVKAPDYWSGVAEGLELNIFSVDGDAPVKVDTFNFNLEVAPVADGITINPTATFGNAGTLIPINLNAVMPDTDGSETVTLEITGLGAGADFFGAGRHLDYKYVGDTYTISGITPEEVRDLYFVQQEGDPIRTIDVKARTIDKPEGFGEEYPSDPTNEMTFKVTMGAFGGTSGNDTMLYYEDVEINGKGGTDTLLFTGENQTVNFNTEGVAANIKNFEIFDLTGNGAQSLENLSAEHVLAMSGDNGTLIIKGDNNGDSVSLDGDWTKTEGDGFNTYTSEIDGATAKLVIENGIEVTSNGTIAGLGGMGRMMAMGAFSPDPEEGESDGQSGSSASYEPFPQSGESGAEGREWDSSSPSSQESEESSHGSDWNAAGGTDSGDGDSGHDDSQEDTSGGSETGSDVIPVGSDSDSSSGDDNSDSGPEGQGVLEDALEGISADDVLDTGGDELPLPGGDEGDGLGRVPDTGGADIPEFYAPDVPDSASQIAEEMEDALSA